MKASKRKANTGMVYYLKKFWGANFLAILPALAACALQTGTKCNDDPDVSAYH